jgi:hypothetical protein
MHKVAKLLPAMLSVLMVSTSVSVSACDLSCWLNQASPECHSASPSAENRMTASSMMEMSAEMEMDSHAARIQQPLEGWASGITRHLMFAHMRMTRRAPEVLSNTGVSAGATFDHSGLLSPCTHEMCSQDAPSSSPPGTSQSRSPGLHWAVICVSIPRTPLTSSSRILSGAPPLIQHPANLLSAFRI